MVSSDDAGRIGSSGWEGICCRFIVAVLFSDVLQERTRPFIALQLPDTLNDSRIKVELRQFDRLFDCEKKER